MNRDQLVIVLGVAAASVGIAMIVSGLIAARAPARPATRRPRAAKVTAAATGLLVVAVTGWPLPAVMIAALTGRAVALRTSRAAPAAQRELVEALASWIESVRDVMQAGSQPVGAIGVTAESSPIEIRAAVRGLHGRLGAGQPAEVALRRFADELDDPLGDLLAVGLLIAVSRGAETDVVLSSLAGHARHHADRRRVVEAERAPRQREVRALSLIMCLLFAAVFVFARSSYLRAYDDAAGQLFLTVLLAVFGALLWRVAALGRFPAPSRFLTARSEGP